MNSTDSTQTAGAQAQHTPGPWNWHQYSRGLYIYGLGHQVCCIDASRASDMDHEDKANARLIAAAPDLLEALQAFVSDHLTLSECVQNAAVLERALAAIAKTEGKEAQ